MAAKKRITKRRQMKGLNCTEEISFLERVVSDPHARKEDAEMARELLLDFRTKSIISQKKMNAFHRLNSRYETAPLARQAV